MYSKTKSGVGRGGPAPPRILPIFADLVVQKIGNWSKLIFLTVDVYQWTKNNIIFRKKVWTAQRPKKKTTVNPLKKKKHYGSFVLPPNEKKKAKKGRNCFFFYFVFVCRG